MSGRNGSRAAERSSIDPAMLAAAGGASAIALYLLSYALTVRLYEKKDL